MKRFLKILLIVILSLTTLFFVVVLGFRYWLKNNLPQYIKEKTPYNITYKDLKIRFLQGDITATHVKIYNKNPSDSLILGLKGTIDTVYVSNLGVYDALVNKTINSDEIKLSQPNLKITLAKPVENKTPKKKNFATFENIKINNGNIEIERYHHAPFFKIRNLSLNLENLNLTEEGVERKLPFVFDNYSIKGNDFEFYPDDVYKISAQNLDTKEGKMSVKKFSLLPLMEWQEFKQKFPYKNQMKVEVHEMSFEDISLKNNRINFNKILFSQPNITLFTSKMKREKRKKAFTYEVGLKDVIFSNAQFKLMDSEGKEKLTVKNINASVNEFLMDEETAKGKIPFVYKNYHVRSGEFVFNVNEFYKLAFSQLVADKNSWDISQFSMIPLLSREEFSRRISTEKDWFNIHVAQVKVSGIDFKFSNNQPNVNIQNINLNAANAIIYRSKFPKDDLSRKKMYSELLRGIKFPLLVHHLNVTNSYLQYEEDNTNDNPAGKLMFSQFNLKANNLNSNKGHASTNVPIVINCQFMKTSPMNVNWSFDTARNDDFFKISGNISNLPAVQINPFFKPYLNISVEGFINQLNFNFNGNNTKIFGKMNLKHENLKVNLLDEDTKKKKKILSALVNLVVKTDSEKFPESVDVEAKRNNTKSFFNLFWRGIEEGLKKTLISKNIEQTEKQVKKTKEVVKKIKKEIKQETKNLKQKIKKTF